MYAKMTSKNQITLPKAVVAKMPGADYFQVAVEQGRIVLTPVHEQRADLVRAKLAKLGLDADDVAEAVTWARKATAATARRGR